MLKKISSLLIIALILTAVPAGAALALPQDEEQIVKQEVIMGYFDVWKGSDWLDTNNDGDPDIPGQTGKPTKPFNYDATDKLEEYELTRVVVQYPFTTDEYIAAGGRIYGPNGQPWIDSQTGDPVMSWKDFNFYYLKYLPQNLSVQITSQDLTAGKATVKWGLDLIELKQGGTLDLKKPENRQYIGYEPADIGSLVEGWRWYLPGIITWYGIPKESPKNCVASAIDPGVTGTATPNQKYDGTVAFKYFGDQPVQGVPVGVFNGKYQAVLKDASGNVVTSTSFNPNDKKTFYFTWTAPPSGSTTLTGVINVAPLPDRFEETTKDDNKVSVTVNTVPPCTDISLEMGPDEISVESGGQRKIYIDVKRANDGPAGPVPVRVTLKSAAGNKTWDITLNKGETEELEATYTLMRAKSSDIGFTAEAWPQGVDDCRPGNNRASCEVYVDVPFNAPKPPDGKDIWVILIS